jgi:hypothetical protein
MGKLPMASVGGFRGARDTLKLMADMALGDTGERSMLVRHFTLWVLRDVAPKDYLGEILAIRNVFVQPSPWVKCPYCEKLHDRLARTCPAKGGQLPPSANAPLIRYINDPLHVEVVKGPQRLVEEILENGTTLCDCDEYVSLCATMCLQAGRVVELVALGFEPRHLTHVGCRVQEPKTQSWIWLDGVAGPREQQAARRAKEILVWSLD